MRPVSVSFSGPPGCGKSHVAMTFPDPITVIDYDGGLEDVLPKFPEKDVKVINFHLPSTVKTRKAGEKIKMEKVYGENEFEQFMEQYSAELDEGRAQTIVIDTASTLKSVVTAAQRDRQGHELSNQFAYEVPYEQMRAIRNMAYEAGVNLVLLHYVKPLWKAGKDTGLLKTDGFANVDGLVDWSVFMELIVDSENGNKIESTVKKCRIDMKHVGETCDNLTYKKLAAIVDL